MHGYSETIRRYAADHSHAGSLDDADGVGEVGLGEGETGRRLAVRFMLKLTGSRVDELRYQVFGCGYTMAACAAAAEMGEGLTVQELADWSAEPIVARLGGLPRERDYCADLAAQALRAAACSAQKQSPVETFTQTETDHEPSIDEENPVYQALVKSTAPADATPEDRHLFACLLAISAAEPLAPEAALGLKGVEFKAIIERFFPDSNWQPKDHADSSEQPPEINPEVRQLLREHAAAAPDQQLSGWLANILAARAAHPGHLWLAMGLFERPQLSAAIGRLLPTLLDANSMGMRWKRFLFKQVCERNGGLMCKSPVCGDCSDYALCFAPEDEPAPGGVD